MNVMDSMGNIENAVKGMGKKVGCKNRIFEVRSWAWAVLWIRFGTRTERRFEDSL